MFKKSSKPKGLRRRERGGEDDETEKAAENEGGPASVPGPDDEDAGIIVQQKTRGPKRAGDGVLGFSSASAKKAKAAEESAQPRVQGFAFESNREVQVHSDQKATAALETETEFDRDARALREKYLKRAEDALKKGGRGDAEGGKGPSADDKVYKGMNNYVDHTAGFRREHTVSGEKSSGAFGPLRASAHVRMSVRFDYQPDICKDYKETGYCGYGDACKFMHDRGDYKSGWQLEREWDEKQKQKAAALAMGMKGEEEEENEEEEEEEELPFACFICREPFVDPVVTKCQHYFCEHCALKHNSKNKNCFVCNKPTLGVFNTAHEIVKRMKEKRIAEGKK